MEFAEWLTPLLSSPQMTARKHLHNIILIFAGCTHVMQISKT